jgi:hypothetical protein
MLNPLPLLFGQTAADAHPRFLALLVFARASAVVEDVGWCIWHTNVS